MSGYCVSTISKRHVRDAGLVLLTILTMLVDCGAGVDFGKICDHDDDCHDFRLICSKETSSCVCSGFYYWDRRNRVCNLNMTELRHYLASMDEERDFRGELDEQARSTFNQLGFAGIMAVSLGFLGALTCVFLFCILDRKPKDVKLLKDKATPEPTAATSSGASGPTPIWVPIDQPIDLV